MSIIGQQIAEGKRRYDYMDRTDKKILMDCVMGFHKPEEQYHQGVCGNSLKDFFPRRCKHCGELLYPDKWEPVEFVESDCEHEAIGYYHSDKEDEKLVNRFPQQCKKCGIDLKPKTWISVEKWVLLKEIEQLQE